MNRHQANIDLDKKMKELIKKYGYGQIINATANACFEIAQDERNPNTIKAHCNADYWQNRGSQLARTLLTPMP